MCTNAGLILGQHLQRLPSINPALGQHIVLSVIVAWEGLPCKWVNPSRISTTTLQRFQPQPLSHIIRSRCFSSHLIHSVAFDVHFVLFTCIVGSTRQQTRHIDPMLGQCWASVVDGGPTLAQRWVDVSCLLDLSYVHSIAGKSADNFGVKYSFDYNLCNIHLATIKLFVILMIMLIFLFLFVYFCVHTVVVC